MRRPLACLAALVAVATLGACGNKEETITEAHTEGIYVDVGRLTYQVQVSRPLNPRDVEDRDYVKDLPAGTAPLAPDESWFAVFIRVANEEDEPAMAAEEFHVVDTQYVEGRPCERREGCFEAIELGPDNVFAYRPTQLDPDETYPPSSSAAAQGVVGGSLLLFRVPNASYENRPLELTIKASSSATEATVELDI